MKTIARKLYRVDIEAAASFMVASSLIACSWIFLGAILA